MNYHSIKNISFFQIQICLTIAEHGSFTKAASALHVSQPTLSKRLSDLEAQLGLLLFVRGKNTAVRLTPAGKVIIKDWEKVIVLMEQSLKRAFDAQACVHDSITISTVPSANMQIYIEPLLESFSKVNREVEFRFDLLSPSDQAERLLDGTIDIAFVPLFSESLIENDRISSTRVLACPWYVGMLPSNPLADSEVFLPENLKTQHFVVTSPQLYPEFYTFVESVCVEHGFIPNIAYSTKNHMSFTRNVRSDDEVFFVDGCSSLLESNSFVFRELPGVNSGVIMAHSTSNTRQSVTDFLQHAKRFFKSFTYPGTKKTA